MSREMVGRRRFLAGGTTAASGMLLAACSGPRPGAAANREDEPPEEVSPAEDLMREHGVLKRVLLVYRESIRRIDARQDAPPSVIAGAANLIRRFVEDYHERLEEQFLFPRFRKANRLVGLVDTLELQHRRGRELTDVMLRLASGGPTVAGKDRQDLKSALEAFVRMYEPHEAREDTVLFPEFRKLVSSHEYAALGEDFEKKEHDLFGEDGFGKNVEEVAKFEQALGIYDLAQFTPAKPA